MSSDRRFTLGRYWSIDDYLQRREDPLRAAGDYADEYASLLERAVQKQLMADVPVGVLLSRGLDSCTLTAIAARSDRNIQCFNILDERDDSGETGSELSS